MSKTFTATSAVLLPKTEFFINSNIVRLNNSRIDAKKIKNTLFWRNETVIIKKPNGAFIIRSVAGNPGNVSINKNAIAVDYDGRSTLGILGIEKSIACDLIVRPANLFEITRWYLNHPDTGYQLATRIAVLGVLISMIGLIS